MHFQTPMSEQIVVLAGATGNLGSRVARNIIEMGGAVRALVRVESPPEDIAELKKLGALVTVVDYANTDDLARACDGAMCVVSTLSGLRDVIVETQSRLLAAAVQAGVPRFIPSDFAIDFTKLLDGSNRNFDLRREFQQILERAPIRATSILNGMFTDLLTGPAPVILFKWKRVMYWGNSEQTLDFTTIDDTAAFTAAAALDADTPRFLYIAGDQISARGIANVATDITGERFRLLRAGSLRRLAFMIRIMRRLTPANHSVFPPWQGMQYLHNMFEGRAAFGYLDNDRYGQRVWTRVRDVLAEEFAKRAKTR